MAFTRTAARSFFLALFCFATVSCRLPELQDDSRIVAARDSSAVPNSSAPRFFIRNEQTNWWLLTPEGRKFFSLGGCCVNQGPLPNAFDSENPSYAAWQHYSHSNVWADSTLRRLKSWGFTTVGGWSDFAALRESREQTLWLTPVLHIGSTAGAPWWDMWNEKNIRRMENIAREQIATFRDDPRLLGYYSDNELGWWNATLWKMTLEQPSSSGQRQRLIQLLRDVYDNDWNKLLQDFEPENAASWWQLRRSGTLYLKSGGNGIHVMRRFLGLLADRYYQLMRDIIHKYDPRALFLGDRYQSFYYPEVARAAGRYVDAVSSNVNASWNDGTFLRCYLDTLHALTGKPILVGEFYLAATNNRSGNRNSMGIFPVVGTQRERADAARTTLLHFARLPYVLGADWFQFTDEPTHGRADGENFNFGLVDIHDRPYEELTSVFASLSAEEFKTQSARPRPDVSTGVPPAPREPFANFAPTQALKHWDRERGFVKATSEFPLGDLYLCWSREALYLGIYAIDVVEAACYRDSSVPKIDRSLWTVQINGRDVARARLGAAREALVSDARVRVENISGLNLHVRNIAAMEVPAKVFGKDELRSGDSIELDCTLLTHCGAYRMEWRGRFTLRE